MPATQVSGRHARIDVTLDGIAFTRSESRPLGLATRRTNVEWDDVTGATVQLSRKGRPVIRVTVSGERTPEHHRDDPFAVKVRRRQLQSANEVVQGINAEVEVRRRWRAHSERLG